MLTAWIFLVLQSSVAMAEGAPKALTRHSIPSALTLASGPGMLYWSPKKSETYRQPSSQDTKLRATLWPSRIQYVSQPKTPYGTYRVEQYSLWEPKGRLAE